MTEPVFSAEEVQTFVEAGFVQARNLLPSDLVETTRRGLAEHLGINEADPSTWRKTGAVGEAWSITRPCWTPGIEAAGKELVGPHIAHGPKRSPYLESTGRDPWIEGYIPVLNFPVAGDPSFTPPTHYHIDGMHYVSHWPTELYLVVFAYLVDVKPYGGATVVLPGSHRRIFEHWCQHPEAAESKELPDLAYLPPLPIEGKAGDVLFMHYLCAHSGSANHDDHIRFGLNSSINVDPAHPYQRRTTGPRPDWTPLDWTLRTDNIPDVAGVAGEVPRRARENTA